MMKELIMAASFLLTPEAMHLGPDVTCMAMNIYMEAGNQSEAGKLAVGHVTLNRVLMERYPSSICGVVTQGPTYQTTSGMTFPIKWKCQFSWFCDGKPDKPVDSVTWNESITIANMLLYHDMHDFTEGATHYHNDQVDPAWNKQLKKLLTIDNHTFYR